MLAIGKYKDNPDNHRAIAQEIYDFFSQSPVNIATGVFCKTRTGENGVNKLLTDEAAAFCLRGARFRLIGVDPCTDFGAKCGYTESEQQFCKFLGYELKEDAEDPSFIVASAVDENNYHQDQMMARLRKVLGQ